MVEAWRDWLKRARSNLALAAASTVTGVAYEDLCFEAQQSAEKALKAVIIFFGLPIPKVHSFHVLLTELEKKIPIPEPVKQAIELTDFAVQTRYPGDYTPVTKAEYDHALAITVAVVSWAEQILIGEEKDTAV